jgi:superfamily I DNA and RNA helicase
LGEWKYLCSFVDSSRNGTVLALARLLMAAWGLGFGMVTELVFYMLDRDVIRGWDVVCS